MDYADLVRYSLRPDQVFRGTLLALDPGETTGFAVFQSQSLPSSTNLPLMSEVGQIISSPLEQGIDKVTTLITRIAPTHVVYEDYKVYAWKANAHSWGSLHTPQLIGAIRTLCRQNKIPYYTQMAQQPKEFVTDDKLRQWGFYAKGQKHARDACRHALFYMLFNHSKTLVAPKKTS